MAKLKAKTHQMKEQLSHSWLGPDIGLARFPLNAKYYKMHTRVNKTRISESFEKWAKSAGLWNKKVYGFIVNVCHNKLQNL